jgi:hypothetical protein
MNELRLRVWPSGAFLATYRPPYAARTNVLEFDGRGRYHLVTASASGWRETDLRIGSSGPGSGVWFKTSEADGGSAIKTSWIIHAPLRAVSRGMTTVRKDGSTEWTQTTVGSDGSRVRSGGDGTRTKRLAFDRAGNTVSDMEEHTSSPTDAARTEAVTKNKDGSTTRTTQESKRAPDGAGTLERTVTTHSAPDGRQTSQTTVVTKQSDDGSRVTQTTTVDTDTGTKTETITAADPGTKTSTTTVKDTNTGESVTTHESTTTSTDAQGNTVTTTTSSVSSSDGFGVTHIDATSSDGSSSSQQITTDTQGNQTETRSVTDTQGNTTTQTLESNADTGNTQITTTLTDPAGNGSQTVDTFDASGNQTSSSTEPVGPDAGGAGAGRGSTGGDNSGGDEGGGGNEGEGGGSEGEGGGSEGEGGGAEGEGGGAEGGGGDMPPDDGSEEGPRGHTPRVAMGFGVIDDGGEGGGSLDGDDRRIGRIGDSLGSYAAFADENGWGDAAPEGAVSPPEVDINIRVQTATDDWGDLNDPRVIPAFGAALMVAAANAAGRRPTGGVLRALLANTNVEAQSAGAIPELGQHRIA